MKKIIKTNSAPSAIGPYSQAVAVECGKMLFISGQIPLDPATMELVGQTAAEQCQRVMKNLEAVLKEAGASFSKVVKQ